MLERDLYLLVCLAFNHWHTGIDDPSLYPQCVLAIHSSKRLIVEQITPPPYLLADAIISLTLQKGQRHEGREGMTAYYLTKGMHSNYYNTIVYDNNYFVLIDRMGWSGCDGRESS
jgi:calpain-15